MTWRQWLKYWVYGSCPGFRGRFRYFGAKVYFPPGSVIFRVACENDVFEREVMVTLQRLARPGAYFFDVGANIGLMSVAVLGVVPDCHVVSLEPSPNVLPFLERTVRESAWADCWEVVPKAAASSAGRATFSVSSAANSAFDGMRATGRVSGVRQVEVETTTLDAVWEQRGSPAVALIKMDIEGAEFDALRGARRLLEACRPAILLEWNETNFSAYGVKREDILVVAAEAGYRLHALPSMVRVKTGSELAVHMGFTESFLMLDAR